MQSNFILTAIQQFPATSHWCFVVNLSKLQQQASRSRRRKTVTLVALQTMEQVAKNGTNLYCMS